MKKLLFISFTLLVLVGCKQTYEYQFYSDGQPLFSTPKTIKVDNEEIAFKSVVDDFDSYFDLFEKKYIDKTVSFEIINSKTGAKVENTLGLTPSFYSKQEEYKKEQERIKEEEVKAFAGATFGMTIKEVMNIPYYKKDFRKSSNDEVRGSFIKVGNEYYNIKLWFENDKLYRVLFNNYPQSANYLSTDIKKEVENLREIIENACGKPSFNRGFPSILDLNEGMVTWAYKWEIGKKAIRIGVTEQYKGSEYNVYAEIIDTVVEQEIENAEKEKKKEIQNSSSSLF